MLCIGMFLLLLHISTVAQTKPFKIYTADGMVLFGFLFRFALGEGEEKLRKCQELDINRGKWERCRITMTAEQGQRYDHLKASIDELILVRRVQGRDVDSIGRDSSHRSSSRHGISPDPEWSKIAYHHSSISTTQSHPSVSSGTK